MRERAMGQRRRDRALGLDRVGQRSEPQSRVDTSRCRRIRFGLHSSRRRLQLQIYSAGHLSILLPSARERGYGRSYRRKEVEALLMTSSLANPIRFAVGMIALTIIVAISPAPAECFPWSIDMYRGPEIQPLAIAPRVTPADTLPVHGEPPMSLEQATLKMHNPLQQSAQNLASGREQFNTYCAPCHGASGQGDGPVAHLLSKPARNLISGSSKYLPDGYI